MTSITTPEISPEDIDETVQEKVSPFLIGREFLKIGLTAFGGGLSAHFFLCCVEKHKWLNPREFLDGMLLSQLLPGSNMANFTAYFGLRRSGFFGALLGFLAVLTPGAVLLVFIGPFYLAYQDVPEIRRMLAAIGAAACGLIGATAIRATPGSARSRYRFVITGLTFLLFGALRLPLWLTLIGIAPVAVWLNRPGVD